MHKNWMQHSEENDSQLNKLWNISEGYKHDYQPDVEKGLNALKARIAKDKDVATISKVVPMRKQYRLARIAAAIALLLVGSYLLNVWLNSNPAMEQVATTKTLMNNIQLPDGSTVWLNKHSQLSYPKTFDGATRTVQLEGEAFFKVTKNTAQPFIVKTVESEVKVLGTAFNVRAYSNEPSTIVEVEEGSVAFHVPTIQASETLKANDKVVYDKSNATLSAIQPLDWKETAWKEEFLKFDDEAITEVAAYLNSNFGVQLKFDQEKLGNCPLNATFVENQPEAILKAIQSAFSTIQLKKVQLTEYDLSGSCD